MYRSIGRWMADAAVLFFKMFCATLIIAAIGFTIYATGPQIETRYFPVVSKLKILRLQADIDGNSIVQAEFTKIRNCEYLGLAWFRGKNGGFGFERVPVEIMRQDNDRSSPDRPVGTQRAGPWIVHMTPEDLMANSFARLSHKCHGFWVSTTDFYP